MNICDGDIIALKSNSKATNTKRDTTVPTAISFYGSLGLESNM